MNPCPVSEREPNPAFLSVCGRWRSLRWGKAASFRTTLGYVPLTAQTTRSLGTNTQETWWTMWPEMNFNTGPHSESLQGTAFNWLARTAAFSFLLMFITVVLLLENPELLHSTVTGFRNTHTPYSVCLRLLQERRKRNRLLFKSCICNFWSEK